MDCKQAKELVRTFIQVPMASGTRQEELDFYKDINDAFVMLLNALEENEKLDKIKEVMKDDSLSVTDTYGVISEILDGNFEYYNNLKKEYDH